MGSNFGKNRRREHRFYGVSRGLRLGASLMQSSRPILHRKVYHGHRNFSHTRGIIRAKRQSNATVVCMVPDSVDGRIEAPLGYSCLLYFYM